MLGMDKTTEEISHFIGIFHTSLEAARQRDSYDDFSFSLPRQDVQSNTSESETFATPFELLGYDPFLFYRPVAPLFPKATFWEVPSPVMAAQSVVEWRESPPPDTQLMVRMPAPVPAAEIEMPPIEPVGSVLNYIQQHIILSDNDVFSVGNHALAVVGTTMATKSLLDAADMITSMFPLSDVEAPGSVDEMISLVKTAAEALDVAAQEGDFLVAQTGALSGSYVNGELVTEVPRLEDYHSFEDEEDEGSDDAAGDAGDLALANSGPLAEASVTIEAGENVLVNNAVLKTLWTGAKVTAVLGDHVEVNAIVQINAIWDEDDLGVAFAGWNSGDPNQLFNIASFEREGGSTDGQDTISEAFPAFWTVTKISGDLMIVNWIEQYTFVSDQDIGIVSASGGHAHIVSGGNTGVNHVSIYELGFAYDLIIIGGSVYDASIIQQFNILFDSDTVDGAGGFETSGAGTVSSSGNLLWNQATIFNIGAADRFEGLSQDYVNAAMSAAGGELDLSAEILDDPAFAGLAGLRVLYISGDMINLQLVRQTNIVGDNDQIALAMDAMVPRTGASYVVETGGNTLVNNAAILDLDSLGKTYVGGEQYSQETLIQAEFISSRPDLGGQDPTLLASEAVLFLDDSMLEPDPDPAPGVLIVADHTQSQDDGLQTILH
ncbi:conserved protein of unknown function [Pseudorhizobium banfieldiae]|uniref:Type I secretion protein n=1 Tax=Pseudorhizobium banfieldiae TaxID=1125847 RepID=L0NIX6_9HYPH|nr:hypothetical protein [Pseudorhizobium banfieldiae]CAD6618417.1 type I secretion protein [arsenite-oxidising bacterium NT-25]CCF21040.1 conserved protein of unknown function [Pseudorhizobium banfieldiae]